MARVKLTEFRAKHLLFKALNDKYLGISYPSQVLGDLEIDKTYVVKVDQGVKKRFKEGLVFLNLKRQEIKGKIEILERKGYSNFLIEEYIVHDKREEKYLSIERDREGILILYSKKGGIDIEENKDAVHKKLLNKQELNEISVRVGLEKEILQKIIDVFEKYYFSFLEINPIFIKNNKVYILDVAAEVDSAAQFFVDGGWTSKDFVQTSGTKTDEEKNIEALTLKSQASFKLDVTNKDGSIFVLLSGGGASVVVADEIYNLGYGHKLGNYGEYSGNPTEEETYIYTRELLSLLLKSKSPKKALIIGGGVANFTDVRITFKGIIKALSEKEDEITGQKVRVFVRRGGPNQEEGLALMEKYLSKSNLMGSVSGPELILTDIVKRAINYIND